MLWCQCLSVRLSVTFVHCSHRVQWIPDIFSCLGRWMSLLHTNNASPESSDGMMPEFLVEDGRGHLALSWPLQGPLVETCEQTHKHRHMFITILGIPAGPRVRSNKFNVEWCNDATSWKTPQTIAAAAAAGADSRGKWERFDSESAGAVSRHTVDSRAQTPAVTESSARLITEHIEHGVVCDLWRSPRNALLSVSTARHSHTHTHTHATEMKFHGSIFLVTSSRGCR